MIANTGDDFEHLGLSISPDIDTLLYTLADINNPVTGWGRRDETKEEGAKFAVQGGWRERAQQPQREHRERGDRDWDRGGNRGDEDPEWMDAKVEKKKEPQMKTQADFERWKEQMKAKDAPAEERGAPKESNAAPAPATATGIAAGPMFTAPVHTPGPAEPTQGILFGNWGNVKGAELGQDESIKVKAKPAKASKFMSMFAKPEEQAAPNPMPAPAAASIMSWGGRISVRWASV